MRSRKSGALRETRPRDGKLPASLRRASRDHADAARKRRTLAKRAQRFVLQLPIRFREKGEETWHEGTTLNISESGVLFQAACRLRPQATIEMALTLPSAISGEAPGQILCQGLVVRSVSGSEAEGMHRLSAAISRFKFARAKPARGTAARA